MKGQFTSVEYKTSNKNILYRYSFSGRRWKETSL